MLVFLFAAVIFILLARKKPRYRGYIWMPILYIAHVLVFYLLDAIYNADSNQLFTLWSAVVRLQSGVLLGAVGWIVLREKEGKPDP